MLYLILSWFITGVALGVLLGMIYPLVYAWRFIRKILTSIEMKKREKVG